MIIYNKYIPFKGFSAVNLFGFIFARIESKPLSNSSKNHESIHTLQQREMLYVFFYIWYGIEWLIKFLICFNVMKAYYSICFEQEAYRWQYYTNYLNERKHYSWLQYIFTLKDK